MKGILKVVLALAAVIGIAVGAVFLFTADMVDVADRFFSAVRANNLQQATGYLSADFRRATNDQQLAAFLQANGLDRVKSESWSSRTVDGSRGTLKGTAMTDTGAVPLTMIFVKTGSDWLIHTIRKPQAGAQVQGSRPAVAIPAPKVLQQMADDTIHAFALAVQAKSMKGFYAGISKAWQDQTTPEKLDEVFKPFFESGMDLTKLRPLKPGIKTRKGLDKNGVLTVDGSYNTKPKTVSFEQKFIFENGAWKLLGIRVNVK
ncbi:MAG: hypothetical protein LJE84_02550 [Gammaproteobacteria bacterium]|nr:hypothetical protein [Gammaproteobacteria bacterium]